VELFAVAYGIDGHTDVNHVLMKQLADGSAAGGQVRNVDEESTTASALALALRDAIKSGLTDATSPSDPTGVFPIGDGEIRHDVVITPFDTKAAFVLSWNTPGSRRLRLVLVTPTCEVITPENAGHGRYAGVTFRGGDRSQMYLVDPDFLNPPVFVIEESTGGGTPPRPRYGTWTFVITSPNDPVILLAEETADARLGEGPPPEPEQPDTENYAYDVLVDSALKMSVSQDRPTYFAGDPVTITARLAAAGRPVTHAAVLLSTTLPQQSLANFLADVVVPADALAEARRQLEGQDATPLLIKQRAAEIAGIVFDGRRRTVSLPMTDTAGNGVYRALFGNTSVPEHYTFYVSASGVTDDGTPFRREGKQETFVLVRPDAQHSQLDVHQVQAGVADVTIIPRDRFGNVLLIDPTTPGGFGLVAPGATLGPLTSTLDGSYGTRVTFNPAHPPSIGVGFGGATVIPATPIPAVGDLTYIDKVVKFEPGQITTANRHADPAAALGTVLGKPADRFLSLGAGGRLTAAFNRRIILASGHDDDITVFVRPDTDRRSYRLEAYVFDHKRWVSLGDSIGVTQSFGLRPANLVFALALRVVDTSGRTRGAGAVPLTTPGVSISGIGVRKTTHTLPWPVIDLPDWLHW
jgi:hypothetical protein